MGMLSYFLFFLKKNDYLRSAQLSWSMNYFQVTGDFQVSQALMILFSRCAFEVNAFYFIFQENIWRQLQLGCFI